MQITNRNALLELLQNGIVKLLAQSPAGHKLCLIGGFRYRLLNKSARLSKEIDYHWSGDLEGKQMEIVCLLRGKLFPQIAGKYNLEGNAAAATGPNAESTAVKIIDVAFWQPGAADSRIEIPVEITRIQCADPMTVRAADGVVLPTPSDPDVIEGKVLAVINRPVLEYRDLLDLFLFSSHLLAGSPVRLKDKFAALSIGQNRIEKIIGDLRANPGYHAKGLDKIIDTDVDAAAAENLRLGGGGRAVLDAVLPLLARLTEPCKGGSQ